MTWKEFLLDFIQYALFLALLAFVIIFFFVGDRMGMLYAFVKSLVPFAYFGMLFLIKLKINRVDFKTRERDNDTNITLHLKYFDKFLVEIIVFLIPIIILGIAFLDHKVGLTDILQALAAFLLAYVSLKIIFKNDK